MSILHSEHAYAPIAPHKPNAIVRASRSYRKTMRDTPAARKLTLVTAGMLLLAGFAGTIGMARISPSSPLAYRFVDVRHAGSFIGPWQRGRSVRSFKAGSSAEFRFTGSRVALIGVLGDKGGDARILLDDKPAGIVTFYARHKETNRVVYASPVLKRAKHRLQVIVLEPSASEPHRRFTNIDGFTYFPGS